MHPTGLPRTRSAAAFQLAAAVDHYLLQLSELSRADPEQCAQQLARAAEAMRAIRLRCAGRCELNGACVELLIGHSELAYKLSLTRGRTGRAQVAQLFSAQSARAEVLLRLAAGPLFAEH